MSTVPLSLNAWLRWDVIRAQVDRIGPRSILELGVGAGAMGSHLAAMTDTYVGLEPDDASRELAGSRLPTDTELIADMSAVAGRRFALVCAFEVIEHIEDDRTALAEWVERVEPGGYLLLSTPAFADRMGEWDRRVGHYRRYDPESLAELLGAVGLVDVDVTAVGFPLGHVLEAARNGIARVLPRPEVSMDERTASSGRTLQPPGGAVATRVITAPFRRWQRRFPDRGTGLVGCARRPAC